MLFLLHSVLYVAARELTGDHFRRESPLAASANKETVIRCAVSCLLEETCLAYTIHTNDGVCSTSPSPCGEWKGSICYKKTSNARRRGKGFLNKSRPLWNHSELTFENQGEQQTAKEPTTVSTSFTHSTTSVQILSTMDTTDARKKQHMKGQPVDQSAASNLKSTTASLPTITPPSTGPILLASESEIKLSSETIEETLEITTRQNSVSKFISSYRTISKTSQTTAEITTSNPSQTTGEETTPTTTEQQSVSATAHQENTEIFPTLIPGQASEAPRRETLSSSQSAIKRKRLTAYHSDATAMPPARNAISAQTLTSTHGDTASMSSTQSVICAQTFTSTRRFPVSAPSSVTSRQTMTTANVKGILSTSIIAEASQKSIKENHDATTYHRLVTARARITSAPTTENVKERKKNTDYLVFFPDQLSEHSVQKRNLQTDEDTSYSGLSYVNITSVTFMPLSRQFLLCIGPPYTITTCNLTDHNKTPLRQAKTLDLEVDEQRKLIFYSLDTDVNEAGKVMSMSTGGQDVKTLKSAKEKAYSLSIDVKTQTLYIAYEKVIVAVNYITLVEKKITSDTHIKAVTLDHVKGILYYSQRWNLVKIVLSTNAKKKIINMWNMPEDLAHYKNRIYVISTGAVNVQKVGRLNKKRVTMGFIKIKGIGFHPYVCIIDM